MAKWDKCREQNRRYYSGEGVAPTITTCSGGNTEPKVIVDSPNEIIKTCIKQKVKVRKYNVEVEKLKSLLKNSKQNSGLTTKQISEKVKQATNFS